MELKKVLFKTASDICRDIDFNQQHVQELESCRSPAHFLLSLIETGHNFDATKFLARALPKREATWWACLSVQHFFCEFGGLSEERYTLGSTEKWVFEPNDENRYAAYSSIEKLENDKPAYWAAMAAYWSGGSISPIDQPEILPLEHIYSIAVSGAVALSALREDKDQQNRIYDLYLRQGVAIANGEDASRIII